MQAQVQEHATYLGRPVAHWVEALGDRDPLRRRLAAYALGEIGPAARDEAVPALVRALGDGASFVRVWAASGLAKTDPTQPQVVPALEAALRDPAAFVRSLGAWHLGRLGPDLPGVEAVLPALQELLDDRDANVRAEAALTLKHLQSKGVRQRG